MIAQRHTAKFQLVRVEAHTLRAYGYIPQSQGKKRLTRSSMKAISPISQKNSSSYLGGGKKRGSGLFSLDSRFFFRLIFFRPSVMLEIVARVCHTTSCPWQHIQIYSSASSKFGRYCTPDAPRRTKTCFPRFLSHPTEFTMSFFEAIHHCGIHSMSDCTILGSSPFFQLNINKASPVMGVVYSFYPQVINYSQRCYPLVNVNKKLWKMALIKIDGLPVNSIVIFQFAMLVIPRGYVETIPYWAKMFSWSGPRTPCTSQWIASAKKPVEKPPKYADHHNFHIFEKKHGKSWGFHIFLLSLSS